MSTYSLTNEAQVRNFTQIDVKVDPEYGIVWIYQTPNPRPCFNPTLVSEVRAVQLIMESNNGKFPYNHELITIKYMVLDSSIEGVFSLGGDLSLFRDFIIRKDKQGFLKYVKVCIDVIHDMIVGCRLPIITISLVRGDAMGGGFEVAMSNQVLIAEENVKMGFPEVLFNIFPGMGGYYLLSQRLPQKQVEKMMLNGRIYDSKELYAMGIIDKLAEEGKGREAVYEYVKEVEKYRNAYMAIKNVREKVNTVTYEDLLDVCNYWVDVCMKITDRDLRLMDRLVKAQTKKYMSASASDIKPAFIA